MIVLTPEPWMRHAACLDHDPDLGYDYGRWGEREAKAVCRGCDVRVPCLNYALQTADRWGVWGGLTGEERLNLRGRSA